MKKIYHSALAKGTITYSNVAETKKAVHPKGIMMQNDIIADGLPEQFDECDVLYAEPPWRHGFKIFNKRAGVDHASYNDLADAISKIITGTEKPVYILLGQQMLNKLPRPNQLFETILNGNGAMVAIWRDTYTGLTDNTEVICQNLGSRYKCLGDFTCGYGACVQNFLEGGGKRFVASDYDGKCITVMSAQMKKV